MNQETDPDDGQNAEVIERRLTVSSRAGAAPEHSGYLTKLGGSKKRSQSWKKRFFQMTDDAIAYLDKKGGTVKGGILMETVKSVRNASEVESGKRLNVFAIVTASRTYIAMAESEAEKDEWMAKIMANVTNAPRAGGEPKVAATLQEIAVIVKGSGSDSEKLAAITALITPDDQVQANDAGSEHADATAAEEDAGGVTAAGFGSSNDESVAAAVTAAIMAAGVASPSVAFVACTVSRDPATVHAEFAKQLPGVILHGVTTSGAVLTKEGPKPNSIGCLLISSGPGNFAAASGEGSAASSAASLKEQMPAPKAILLAATPGAEEAAIADIEAVFGKDVPIFGGTAADDDVSGKWSVLATSGASSTGVSLVGVDGSVVFGGSMTGPYTPTEKVCVATKSEGRQVSEIDGKPAADWVLAWLGDEIKTQYEEGGLILPQTAQKPIGIELPSGEYTTGHLAALGGESKTVDFFFPVPEGSKLIVMDSGDGPDTGYAAAIGAAFDIAKDAAAIPATPKAGLMVYCGGMAIAVGDNLADGLSNAKIPGGADFPLLGMCCFGEQGCLPIGKQNIQRNLSIGFLLFD